MSKPLVSVVMPVYNGENYLNEAIDSILNQTYSDFEFIILNDGSTDRTEEIILSYKDPRIVYVKNPENLQIVRTLNRGIALAKGKYIARMDADDISLPVRFEKQLYFMENNPDVGVCGTWVKTFGENVNSQTWQYPVESEVIKVSLIFNSPFAHPSVFIRKSLFDLYSYEESFTKAEDYYLWYQSKDFFNFANLPQVLLCYRIHPLQTGALFSDPQLVLSKKIRLMALNEIGIYPSPLEEHIHEAIIACGNVDYDDALDWLLKINSKNLECGQYLDSSLKHVLHNNMLSVFSCNSKHGIRNFTLFLKYKNKFFIKPKLIEALKVFIKSLIK